MIISCTYHPQLAHVSNGTVADFRDWLRSPPGLLQRGWRGSAAQVVGSPLASEPARQAVATRRERARQGAFMGNLPGTIVVLLLIGILYHVMLLRIFLIGISRCLKINRTCCCLIVDILDILNGWLVLTWGSYYPLRTSRIQPDDGETDFRLTVINHQMA